MKSLFERWRRAQPKHPDDRRQELLDEEHRIRTLVNSPDWAVFAEHVVGRARELRDRAVFLEAPDEERIRALDQARAWLAILETLGLSLQRVEQALDELAGEYTEAIKSVRRRPIPRSSLQPYTDEEE